MPRTQVSAGTKFGPEGAKWMKIHHPNAARKSAPVTTGVRKYKAEDADPSD